MRLRRFTNNFETVEDVASVSTPVEGVAIRQSCLYGPSMRVKVMLPIVLTVMLARCGSAAPLPVTLRDGQAHVLASALEREAGIVIKKLPGPGEFVACGTEQCAPLKSVRTEGDIWLVPVVGLADALHLTANYDESRRLVTLLPAAGGSSTSTGPARVGSIAPNLRLVKIDGTPVSLDELRGQRVLINSWASW